MNTLQHQTEHQLVDLLLTGNENALAELLNRNKNKLFTAIYLLVKDRYIAEDIFQEACIKVVNQLRKGAYKEEGKFLPWAMRIARNKSLDYLRMAKKNVKVTLPDGTDIFDVINIPSYENREEELMKSQTGDRVKRMLSLLPYEQREVIVLRMYGNYNFKQIATLTKVNVNTALGRMRYGLINLRKVMEEKRLVL